MNPGFVAVLLVGCIGLSGVHARASELNPPSSKTAGLAKAWSCKPVLKNHRTYEFINPACLPGGMLQSEVDRLIALLAEAYGDPKTEAAGIAFSAEWERRAKAAEEHERRIAEATTRARQIALKQGKANISSYDDALLVHESLEIEEIMRSPLLSPDSKVYAGAVMIDGQQEVNFLRVRSVTGEPRYAFIRISPSTKSYAVTPMRINNSIRVLGRYSTNAKYRTVIGAERVAPIIEVLYIGSVP